MRKDPNKEDVIENSITQRRIKDFVKGVSKRMAHAVNSAVRDAENYDPRQIDSQSFQLMRYLALDLA